MVTKMIHTHDKLPEIPIFPEDTGLKKTKQREEVFQILALAEEPMGAQEIYQHLLTHTGNKSAYAISTVYRILAAFEEKNLVSKSTLPGGENAVYELNRGHRHYALCLGCHKLIPLEHCPFEHRMLPDMSSSEFTVTGHKLELYGYCKDCKAAGKDNRKDNADE